MLTGKVFGVKLSHLPNHLPLRCMIGQDASRKKKKKEKQKTPLSSTITVGQKLNRNQIVVGGWSACQNFMASSASLEEFLELLLYINSVMFLLMFLHAKWPPEKRNHHTTDDRDWSWRAPDLSIMMSKLCSYMSTGCSVKWYIKHFKTTLNALPDGNSEKKNPALFLMWRQILYNKWKWCNSVAIEPGPRASKIWHDVNFCILAFYYFFIFVCEDTVFNLLCLHLTFRERHANLIIFNFNLTPQHTLSQLTLMLMKTLIGNHHW